MKSFFKPHEPLGQVTPGAPVLGEGQSRVLGLVVGRSIGMGTLQDGVAAERCLSRTILRCEPAEFTISHETL